ARSWQRAGDRVARGRRQRPGPHAGALLPRPGRGRPAREHPPRRAALTPGRGHANLSRMTPPRRWILLAPALALALSPTLAPATGLEVTRVTLGNGLRVILDPDSLAGTVDATLWYRSGSRHETGAQAGLAVLAARLTFRNGASDPVRALEAEGGTGQLAVTPDFTSLAATVPVEGLGTALDFLAARLPGDPVSAPELAAERAAIRAERARPERTVVARSLAKL